MPSLNIFVLSSILILYNHTSTEARPISMTPSQYYTDANTDFLKLSESEKGLKKLQMSLCTLVCLLYTSPSPRDRG